MRLFALFFLVVSAGFSDNRCLQCHGNQPAASIAVGQWAPLLPQHFSMRWVMYEFSSAHRPPFDTIPQPHTRLSGVTHYDWKNRVMTEIYHDRCIDIFPGGRDFPCQFTSVGERTYHIRFGKTLKEPASCCQWDGKQFWAPRPDVIRHMELDRSQALGGKAAKWWVLDIPLPGPFGFGFFESPEEPAAFWFPVLSGWVQQNFFDFSDKVPDPKVFELPGLCHVADLPVCE